MHIQRIPVRLPPPPGTWADEAPIAYEDRSILDAEDPSSQLARLLEALRQQAALLPEGGPRGLTERRLVELTRLGAAGHAAEALAAAQRLRQAVGQAQSTDQLLAEQLRRAEGALPGASASARLALQRLAEQARERLGQGDAREQEAIARDLQRATALASATDPQGIAARQQELDRLALQRSALGHDHLVISHELVALRAMHS